MNAERFERMCKEVLDRKDLDADQKAKIIEIYAKEYHAYAERQCW